MAIASFVHCVWDRTSSHPFSIPTTYCCGTSQSHGSCTFLGEHRSTIAQYYNRKTVGCIAPGTSEWIRATECSRAFASLVGNRPIQHSSHIVQRLSLLVSLLPKGEIYSVYPLALLSNLFLILSIRFGSCWKNDAFHYRVKTIPLNAYGDKPAWYSRLVDGGKLPSMELDGTLYVESLDIMRILERTVWKQRRRGGVGWCTRNPFELEKRVQRDWFSLVFYPVEGDVLEKATQETFWVPCS